MSIGDYVALAVIVAIVLAIIIYLIKQKKKGVKCIGCPAGSKCSSCNCNCASKDKTTY